MPLLAEHVEKTVRFCSVYGVVVFMLVLSTVSLSLPISGAIEIPFLLMVIYYWSVYRPTLLPPWLVFVLGLVFDILSGLPLGLSALIFLGMRWVIVDQRLFLMGQSFMMIWIGYAFASFMGIMMQWALYGLLGLHWPPLEGAVIMFFAGILLYPLVSMILHLSHRLLPSHDDDFGLVIK